MCTEDGQSHFADWEDIQFFAQADELGPSSLTRTGTILFRSSRACFRKIVQTPLRDGTERRFVSSLSSPSIR
jgi:hypothetical protein